MHSGVHACTQPRAPLGNSHGICDYTELAMMSLLEWYSLTIAIHFLWETQLSFQVCALPEDALSAQEKHIVSKNSGTMCIFWLTQNLPIAEKHGIAKHSIITITVTITITCMHKLCTAMVVHKDGHSQITRV